MERYKIAIIDDEPMIIKGLQQLVPWDEINCEVCGVAKNGEDGLALVKEKIPDIVISDIRMPKLSGLEMIDELGDISNNMKFIILTGHREFDYAQTAIKLGVVAYLLKPTNIEAIKSAVLEAVMLLDDERSKEEDIKVLRGRMEKIREVDQLISEDMTDDEDEGEGAHKIKFLAAQAITFMKEHYSEKLDLQTVADNLYISTWYLCKVLKQEVDNSFVQLLNEIRIQEAKKLLVETNHKVYEICEMVGYTDKPYFSKTFKKHNNKTPNQYRNEHYK